MSIPALKAAKYILSLQDREEGDLISHMKLQKLLYYAQGCHVALEGLNNPLFTEKIYAWKYGPVVKSVYEEYASYNKDRPLPKGRPPALPEDSERIIDRVYTVFGQFSAWKLSQMTHRETPWQKHFRAGRKDSEIPLPEIRKYFLAKYVK